MKKLLSILVTSVLSVVALITLGFIVYTANMLYVRQHWKVEKQPADSLAWVKFDWVGDSLSGRWFGKAAMLIPVSLDGLPNKYRCQFDLASNTRLYGNSMQPYLRHYASLARKVHSRLGRTYLDSLCIGLGGQTIMADKVELMKDYGNTFEDEQKVPADTTNFYQIGTVGSDICAGRVLIIDYPNQRLCVTDGIPAVYREHRFYDCTLNAMGYVIMKLQVHGKIYNVLFDTGSSMFSIYAFTGDIDEFSPAPVDDSLAINAWGKKKNVFGRMMNDSCSIAGHIYSHIRIYAAPMPAAILPLARQFMHMDAILGNALFVNNTVIVDFKNRKVAVI